jgi:7-cyano-7-deazaguanine synthase
MKDKAIILHSGGLDSTVCLLLALEQQKEIISLGIDYNQKHRIETQYAYAQCKSLNIERKVIKVEWDKPFKTIPKGRDISNMSQSVSPAFLEGRNIVFLSLAIAESAGIGATEVWIGVNSIDYSGYPDCRPEFIESYRNMLEFGYPGGPKIVTPLINMTKPDIAKEADRLGLKKGDTWSCYSPKITSSGVRACNECDACLLHNHAWSSIEHDPQVSYKFSDLSFR